MAAKTKKFLLISIPLFWLFIWISLFILIIKDPSSSVITGSHAAWHWDILDVIISFVMSVPISLVLGAISGVGYLFYRIIQKDLEARNSSKNQSK